MSGHFLSSPMIPSWAVSRMRSVFVSTGWSSISWRPTSLFSWRSRALDTFLYRSLYDWPKNKFLVITLLLLNASLFKKRRPRKSKKEDTTCRKIDIYDLIYWLNTRSKSVRHGSNLLSYKLSMQQFQIVIILIFLWVKNVHSPNLLIDHRCKKMQIVDDTGSWWYW